MYNVEGREMGIEDLEGILKEDNLKNLKKEKLSDERKEIIDEQL